MRTQNFGICVRIFVEEMGHHIVNPNFENYRFISPQPGGDTQNSLSSLSRPNPHQFIFTRGRIYLYKVTLTHRKDEVEEEEEVLDGGDGCSSHSA